MRNITNIPHTKSAEKSGGITLTDITVTPKAVRDKLGKLRPDKAQRPD